MATPTLRGAAPSSVRPPLQLRTSVPRQAAARPGRRLNVAAAATEPYSSADLGGAVIHAARAAATSFPFLVLCAGVLAVTQPAAFSWVKLIELADWRRAASTMLWAVTLSVLALNKELKGLMSVPPTLMLSFVLQWTLLPFLPFAALRLVGTPMVAATGVIWPSVIVLLARACSLLQAHAGAQARAVTLARERKEAAAANGARFIVQEDAEISTFSFQVPATADA